MSISIELQQSWIVSFSLYRRYFLLLHFFKVNYLINGTQSNASDCQILHLIRHKIALWFARCSCTRCAVFWKRSCLTLYHVRFLFRRRIYFVELPQLFVDECMLVFQNSKYLCWSDPNSYGPWIIVASSFFHCLLPITFSSRILLSF